jgi:hypothetical protein
VKGGGWWRGSRACFFGDGSVGAKRYLFFLVFDAGQIGFVESSQGDLLYLSAVVLYLL